MEHVQELKSLGAQMAKRLPAMRGTWIPSLGREDPWKRKWQPTPEFLPRKFHGRRSLVGYSPWGHKELGTIDQPHFHFHLARAKNTSLSTREHSLG